MVSGVNSVSSYSNGVQNTKKKSPVKTGAAIGAGVGLGICGLDYVHYKYQLKRHPLQQMMEDSMAAAGLNRSRNIKIAVGAAAVIAAVAGIGAGIGAIVKAVKGGNTAKDA